MPGSGMNYKELQCGLRATNSDGFNPSEGEARWAFNTAALWLSSSIKRLTFPVFLKLAQ